MSTRVWLQDVTAQEVVIRLHGTASPFELSLFAMTAAVMKVSPRPCMAFLSDARLDHCAVNRAYLFKA